MAGDPGSVHFICGVHLVTDMSVNGNNNILLVQVSPFLLVKLAYASLFGYLVLILKIFQGTCF